VGGAGDVQVSRRGQRCVKEWEGLEIGVWVDNTNSGLP